jgi:hypothetical protein
VIKELFARYAAFGQLALVIAVAAFSALLFDLWIRRKSPRWSAAARLPLDDEERAS